MSIVPRRFSNRRCIGKPQGVGLALFFSLLMIAATVFAAVMQGW